jgi:hypothetical protein
MAFGTILAPQRLGDSSSAAYNPPNQCLSNVRHRLFFFKMELSLLAVGGVEV